MYTALYRAYRPEVFEQLLGQEHITKILKNQIRTGTTSHAYLFCGTRGTGKTTTARLLAKGLNCTSEGERPCGECETCRAIAAGNYLDVVEIDAASNRSIDDIRHLRDSVNYPPAEGRSKVYIIDEVHMLSTEAFNALLKTLEEPPEYVTFILATTEPRKLPATILSRCLRLDFRRVSEPVLIQGMKNICREIGIEVTEPALRIIASNADGSVRDGLSILDQCISGGEKTVDVPQVLDFLGASGEAVFIELTDLVMKRRTAEAIECLAQVLADGKDVRQLIRDWVSHYRNLMMTKFIRDPKDVINLSVENIDRVRDQSSVMELEDINRGIMELSKTADQARWSTQPRILLEVCIVNLCQGAAPRPSSGRTEQRLAPAPVRNAPQPGARGTRNAGSGPVAAVPETAAQSKAAPQSGTQGAGNSRPADGGRSTGAPASERAAQPKTPPQPGAPVPDKATRTKEAPQTGVPQKPDREHRPLQESREPEEALDGLDALIAAARAEAEPEAPEGAVTAEQDTAKEIEPVHYDPSPEEATGASAEAAPAHPPQDGDLQTLWDEIFTDGEHRKGSIYLIRSNGMLTAMDENTFTITVINEMTRRQTERNRDLLEDLMEARTGKRRRMQVVSGTPGNRGEISVEEAAARASEVLGAEVGIE